MFLQSSLKQFRLSLKRLFTHVYVQHCWETYMVYSFNMSLVVMLKHSIYFIGPNKLCHYVILLCLDKRVVWPDHGVGRDSLGHQGQFHVLKVSKNPWQWPRKSSVAKDAWYSTHIVQFPQTSDQGDDKKIVFCIRCDPTLIMKHVLWGNYDLNMPVTGLIHLTFLPWLKAILLIILWRQVITNGVSLLNFLLSKRLWETNDVFLSNCNKRPLP